MNDALNSFSSLSALRSSNEDSADAANSKQPLSSNVLNSSLNDKKLNSKTLLSYDLTATLPASANKEIIVKRKNLC